MFVAVEGNNKSGNSRTWRVNVGTSLPHMVFDEVETIVVDQNEVRADVVRRLLLRGLEAYRRDGLLDEPCERDE
ncbi:MAG: hypothetical protein QOH96_241 [Blastocatellia bacterium]|nr:hypothetical protein [Blastocatellia bacterium]